MKYEDIGSERNYECGCIHSLGEDFIDQESQERFKVNPYICTSCDTHLEQAEKLHEEYMIRMSALVNGAKN